MIELAWVPFVLLFMCFAAYVLENWPKASPFDEPEPWHGEERRR